MRHFLLILVISLCMNFSICADELSSEQAITAYSTNASAIVVTVPTDIGFKLTPNADTVFESDVKTILNSSDSDIQIHFVGFEVCSGTACTVVPNDMYSDDEWSNLSQEDTESKIALGLKHNSEIWWSRENITSSSMESGNYFMIPSGSSETISIAAKHGRVWSKNVFLKYNLHLVIYKDD